MGPMGSINAVSHSRSLGFPCRDRIGGVDAATTQRYSSSGSTRLVVAELKRRQPAAAAAEPRSQTICALGKSSADPARRMLRTTAAFPTAPLTPSIGAFAATTCTITNCHPPLTSRQTGVCDATANGAPTADPEGETCPGMILTVEKKLQWFESWSQRSRAAAAKAQGVAAEASKAFHRQQAKAEQLRTEADGAQAAHKDAASKTDWRARLDAGKAASAAEKAAVAAEADASKLEEAMVEACMQVQAAEYTFEASRAAIVPLKKILVGREALALTQAFDGSKIPDAERERQAARPSAVREERQSCGAEELPPFEAGRSSEWLAESRERAKELGMEMESLLAEMRQMQGAGAVAVQSAMPDAKEEEEEELDDVLREQLVKLEAVAVNSEEAAKELDAEVKKLMGDMAALGKIASESSAAAQELEATLEELRRLPRRASEVLAAIDTLQKELGKVSRRTEAAAEEAQRLESVFSNVSETLRESMELCCAARGLLAKIDPSSQGTEGAASEATGGSSSGKGAGGEDLQNQAEIAPGTVIVSGQPPLASLMIDPAVSGASHRSEEGRRNKDKERDGGRSLSGCSP